MNRTISADDLKPLIERKSVTVVDVRRPNDYANDAVKLPGAQWMNPEQMAEWGKDLPRDQEVVIYCVRGGAVSNSVVDHLQAQGIQARFIEGGIEAWKTAGGPIAAK